MEKHKSYEQVRPIPQRPTPFLQKRAERGNPGHFYGFAMVCAEYAEVVVSLKTGTPI